MSQIYQDRQIRSILEQKYNMNHKQLKGNKDFDGAIRKVVDHCIEEQERHDQIQTKSKPNPPNHQTQTSKTSASNDTKKTIERKVVVEDESLRGLKATLSSQSGGCSLHGLGHHIHFRNTTEYLEMHCNLCPQGFIKQISIPSHLREDNIENKQCESKKKDVNEDKEVIEHKVQEIEANKTRKLLNEWNCHEIIHWLNRVDKGKLNDIKYKCLKKQIKIGNIKGYELSNINDTTLKLIGIKDVKDRKIILNYIFDLISNNYSKEVDIEEATSICGDIPDSFCDPISYEIMNDPVLVTKSGHTYERSFIENYVKQHGIDPITQQKVESNDIVCNRALKDSIKIWQSQNNNTTK